LLLVDRTALLLVGRRTLVLVTGAALVLALWLQEALGTRLRSGPDQVALLVGLVRGRGRHVTDTATADRPAADRAAVGTGQRSGDASTP